jgi:hypothetical protein
MNGDLMAFLESFVIPSIVAGGTALAVLKFLSQRFVDHRLGKDFERYKTELGERTESLKTQLSIYAHEQNVQITRVDAQSAEAISNVYAKMRGVINPLSLILAGTPIVDGSDRQSIAYYLEAAEAAHAAVGNLANTVADHAIYFEDPIYVKIFQFSKAAGNSTALYLQSLRKAIAEGQSDGAILTLAENGRTPLQAAYTDEINPLHKELVAVFRKSLGIQRP